MRYIKPVFTEVGHRYDSSLGRYTSVTTRIHSFEKEKDWDGIAQAYINKRTPEEIVLDLMTKQNKSRQEIVTMIDGRDLNVKTMQSIWKQYSDERCEFGSEEHAYRERSDLAKPLHYFKGEELSIGIDPRPITNYYKDLPDGVYPELLLWDNDTMTSGTADKVIIKTVGTERHVWVLDYKGLPLDTLIPTPTGFTKMKDLQVGDCIYDGNGFVTQVDNVSMVHNNPCFEIVFNTGDKIVCDHEHKWEVDIHSNKKGVYHTHEMTTDDLFEYYSKPLSKKHKKLSVKATELQVDNDVALNIDPYVLGVWLGDGNSHCGTITNMNQEVWNEIERRGYTVGKVLAIEGQAVTCTIHELITGLKSYNLIKNKHIPMCYMRASRNQRLDLLRGFMDADGHYNTTRKRCVMVTTKDWQAKALSGLVSSLGMTPTIIKAKTSGFGKTNIDCFHICFTSEVSPFLARNKNYNSLIAGKNFEFSKRRCIVSVQPVTTIPTKCITVTSSASTYLFGENFIKTHNTNKQLVTYNYLDKRTGEPVVNEYMLPPFDRFCNCNYWHYQIQLNMYGYMLSKFGFVMKGGTIIHTTDNDKEYELKNLQPYVAKAFELWTRKNSEES